MKASETTFQHVIEGTKQYIVPLFQRPYCWVKWTPFPGPLDRGVFVKALPHFNRGWARIPAQVGHRPQESLTEVPRPVHGRAKTSAGRSGIPSLAFHADA